MQNSQYYFYILFILAVFTTAQDKLPDTETCGKLNTKYLYNQKKIAEPDEFPWMGRLMYEKKIGTTPHLCLAVLISKRYMMTDAGCFDEYDYLPYAVVLGDWDMTNKVNESDCNDHGKCAPVPQMFDIEEIVINPNYNPDLSDHHIALLRLKAIVIFSDHIRPICLPGKEVAEQGFEAQHLELAGWSSPLFGDEKRKIKHNVHMMSLIACEGFYNLSFNSESHLCAMTPKDGSIYLGGSALMGLKVLDEEPKYYYLVGFQFCDMSPFLNVHPELLCRIDAYLDWIHYNIY